MLPHPFYQGAVTSRGSCSFPLLEIGIGDDIQFGVGDRAVLGEVFDEPANGTLPWSFWWRGLAFAFRQVVMLSTVSTNLLGARRPGNATAALAHDDPGASLPATQHSTSILR